MRSALIVSLILLCRGGLSLTLPSASRRRWLRHTGAAAAAAAIAPLRAAHAEPSLLSSVQGPIQDIVAPGHWIGQFVGINSKTERWDFAASSPADVSAALVAVLEELTPERRAKLLMPEFRIARADASTVHALVWTKAEWLDTLDVQLERRGRGCVATASFYATGLVPTSVPLAPLINILLAWFPFGSAEPRGGPLQDFRLRALKGLLTKKLEPPQLLPVEP